MKQWWLRATSILLATVYGCSSLIEPPVPAVSPGSTSTSTSAAESTLWIMPLGDSITELDWEGGYRSYLYKLMSDDGLVFDFVGTKITNHDDANLGFPFPQQYWDHEGYNSATITSATGSAWIWNTQIVPKLTVNTPDVILVLLGTNDLNSGAHTPDQVRDDMSAFLGQIWSFNANIGVVLGSVPSVRGATLNSRITAYDALLPALVEKKTGEGRPIILADHHAVMNTTTDLVGDGIHPSPQGYSKMATVWYDAIRLIRDLPPPPPPVDSDGDGVQNALDLCPNTPPGTPVDATGCPITPPSENTVVVYKDNAINPAWINASWTNQVTVNSAEQAISGTSMKGVVGSWGAYKFISGNWGTYKNIDPTAYRRISFSMYSVGNSTVKINLGRQAGTGVFPSTTVSLTAGTWKTISLNMPALCPNGDLFNYILLNNPSSATVTWYVDDLEIVGVEAPPPPPPPPPPPTGTVMYENDDLTSPWIYSGWGTTRVYNNPSPSVEGTSLKVVAAGWGSMGFHSGRWGAEVIRSTNAYTELYFKIYSTATFSLNVSMNGGWKSPSVRVTVNANAWNEVRIPMSAFTSTNQTFYDIQLQNYTSGSQSFYLDKVALR